jgi:hypothetical protein
MILGHEITGEVVECGQTLKALCSLLPAPCSVLGSLLSPWWSQDITIGHEARHEVTGEVV